MKQVNDTFTSIHLNHTATRPPTSATQLLKPTKHDREFPLAEPENKRDYQLF